MSNNPFPRSVLGAAFHMPAIVAAMTPPLPERSMRHAVLVVALAARIHGTSVKVRGAALQMYQQVKDPQRDALLLIVESRDPVGMVHYLLEEIEIMSPDQMRAALLIVQEFQAIQKRLRLGPDTPISDVTDTVNKLLDRDAEAYALEDQIAELQHMLEASDKALAHAQAALVPPTPIETGFDIGKRAYRDGFFSADLYSIALKHKAEFNDVMRGFMAAVGGEA